MGTGSVLPSPYSSGAATVPAHIDRHSQHRSTIEEYFDTAAKSRYRIKLVWDC
jgi:hypothetical protein